VAADVEETHAELDARVLCQRTSGGFRSLARGETRRVSCEKLLYAKDQITWCFQHGKEAGTPFDTAAWRGSQSQCRLGPFRAFKLGTSDS